ncbi:MAG: hypothetical protein N3D75_02975 [Candidatus Aenigmarchaeota archaeon]|nr:hypothetical protein [Candidatus Aenigmarchaeota archaeon]
MGREIITKSAIIFLLFLITVLITKITKDFIKKTSKKLKLDNRIKLGSKISFTEILTNFIVFIIYLVFINSAIEVLDIKVLTDYFKSLTTFVINVFSGIVVLVLFYVAAVYLKKKIIETRLDHSKMIAEIIFVFIMIIAVQISLKVVGIPTNLLESITIIIIASIGLGLAIAIGLGLKDIIADFARKNFKS